MTTTRNRLRILCLHGYRQNDVLFREKTGSLRKQFKKYADFEFISAPLVPNVEAEERGDVRSWWFSRENDQFSSRDVCSIATGFEKSVSVVGEYVRANGPFDGILGFSQGASMAHLLLAMEKNGEIKLGFRFAILFAGFLSLSSVHNCYTCQTLDIPSLHIYGSSDQIVIAATSEELKSMFTSSIAIVHDGGHFIPSMSKYRDIFSEFLERFKCIVNMGNCISEDAQKGHKDFLKSVKSDPEKQVTSFRVYLHRRNKFIHAWLRISADDVTLERSKTDVVVWPLQYLRRYGYTSAGMFISTTTFMFPIIVIIHTECSFSKVAGDVPQEKVFIHSKVTTLTQYFNLFNREFKITPTLIMPKQCDETKELGVVGPQWEQGCRGWVGISSATKLATIPIIADRLQRLRNVVIPPPPRPRSVGETEAPCLPPDSFHPHRHNTFVDQRIVGNIVSESTNPSAVDDAARRACSTTSQIITVEYFLFLSETISRRRGPSNDASFSAEISCTFHIKQSRKSSRHSYTHCFFSHCDAGSTNVLCYTKPISPPVVTPGGDSLLAVEASQHIGRYVNITEAGGRPLLERDGTSSPRPLNYAEVGVGSEPERVPSRCLLLLVQRTRYFEMVQLKLYIGLMPEQHKLQCSPRMRMRRRNAYPGPLNKILAKLVDECSFSKVAGDVPQEKVFIHSKVTTLTQYFNLFNREFKITPILIMPKQCDETKELGVVGPQWEQGFLYAVSIPFKDTGAK
ncbi:serine hydrolase, partial [Ostertagia ostertagi]